jgi:hypothetical protein
MSREIYIGETIYIYVTIYAADGITPRTGDDYSDFSAVLIKNGQVQSLTLIPANFDECGASGTYVCKLTPTTAGDYYLRLKGNNDYYEAWNGEAFTVKLATTGLSLIEKTLKNRITIELGGDGHYYQIVYADNGTSVFAKWRLYDKDGEDIVLTGRGPASRGTPITS